MSISDEQARMLQETHDTVVAMQAALEERCTICRDDVEKLDLFVNGNGGKGAKERIGALERQAKIVWLTVGGVATLLADLLIQWFGRV